MIKHFIVAFLLSSLSCFAQDTIHSIKVDSIIFETSEVQPFTLPSPDALGGGEELKAFILKNIKISKETKESGYYGTIYVSFVVDIDGSVKDVKLQRTIDGCRECNSEVLRVVNMIPKFVPATKNGIPFKVQVNLPIIFRPK